MTDTHAKNPHVVDGERSAVSSSGNLRIIALAAGVICLYVAPAFLPQFWVVNILAKSFSIGIIVLSLNFLTSYCGMVSLAQMTVAGIAGYTLALLSPNIMELGYPVPWPLATLAALVTATILGTIIGVIAQRATEVYLLMLTLALSVCVLYLVQQNMELFNGFDGISGIAVPEIGGVSVHDPVALYMISLTVALVLLAALTRMKSTPFGLALQAMRDSPRRMAALGYPVAAYKIAAFGFAGFIAGIGGILNTWYTPQVSPGTIDTSANISILIMCVLGGTSRAYGAFAGALAYILLENFAIEIIARDRFNLVIGLTFLGILLFSPQGIVGLFRPRAR